MNWTRDQLLAALNLYFQTPFGKQHRTNPRIVELAQQIGRSPSALAMKLNNFTSLDANEIERGVVGLTGASKADKAIWNEFQNRINELAIESEEAIEKVSIPHIAQQRNEDDSAPQGASETLAIVKIRRQQQFFRKVVLSSYSNRCCITGNPIPELLIASHIVAWSEDEVNRANPRNGLCLVATLDAAFDRHLIFFDDDLKLRLSNRIRSFLPDQEVERSFLHFEGKEIHLPAKNLPDIELIRSHRSKCQN